MNSSLRLFLLPLLLLTACQTATSDGDVGANPYRLAGTNWLLIQQGPAGNADNLAEVPPYVYTMALDKNGRVSFKFDCNLGTGQWSSSPAGAEGKISFGTIAATTKICPSESIGEQLSGDMQGSIAYSIYDGRLTMRTPSSGRLYVWDIVD